MPVARRSWLFMPLTLFLALLVAQAALGRGLPDRAGMFRSIVLGHAASSSAAAAGKLYGGTTNSDEPVVLRADRKGVKLKSAAFTFSVDCPSGRTFPISGDVGVRPAPSGNEIPTGVLLAKANKRGRFKTSLIAPLTGSTSIAPILSMFFNGKLKKGTARGTLWADVTVSDPATGQLIEDCGLDQMRWKAVHAPGRVFAGTSQQGMPVVLTANAKHTKVTKLRFGWQTNDCTPPGFIRLGDWINNFHVDRGTFGDAFGQDFPLNGGGTAHYDYVISGRLHKRKASGSFAVTYTETAPSGAKATCRLPTTNWNAASR
jgi:hypothetical protein